MTCSIGPLHFRQNDQTNPPAVQSRGAVVCRERLRAKRGARWRTLRVWGEECAFPREMGSHCISGWAIVASLVGRYAH